MKNKKASEIIKEIQELLNQKVKGDLPMQNKEEEITYIKIGFKSQYLTYTGDNHKNFGCGNCGEEMEETYVCPNCEDL